MVAFFVAAFFATFLGAAFLVAVFFAVFFAVFLVAFFADFFVAFFVAITASGSGTRRRCGRSSITPAACSPGDRQRNGGDNSRDRNPASTPGSIATVNITP